MATQVRTLTCVRQGAGSPFPEFLRRLSGQLPAPSFLTSLACRERFSLRSRD
jgi:hypothetical protein